MRFKYLSSLAIIGLLGAVPLYAQNAGATSGAAGGAADEANMQILRDKVKADKKLVVAANMTLNDAEAKAFWPIYDSYQKDLAGINQRTLKLIAEYATAYKAGPVADSTAKRLLDESLAIEQAEVALRQSYVPKLGKALPPAKVARYLQIESKIRAVIKYDLASNIPLVE